MRFRFISLESLVILSFQRYMFERKSLIINKKYYLYAILISILNKFIRNEKSFSFHKCNQPEYHLENKDWLNKLKEYHIIL